MSDEDFLHDLFEAEAARFLRRLMHRDAALWVGEKGHDKVEIARPNGWQKLDARGNRERLETFDEQDRPAVCLNTGDPLAVVDVDTRNGGDIEKIRALLKTLGVRIFAEVDTPSGGKHFYVKGHPDLPTVHSRADSPKLPDFPGVDLQSFGANVFAPGTLRPKYKGGGYDVVFNELDQRALLADDDDAGTGALAEWVAEQLACSIKTKVRKTSGGAKEWAWDVSPPWTGGTPDARQQAYLDKALADEAANVAGATAGRNNALFEAALKMGSYIAGAGLDEQRVIAALTAAADTVGLVAWTGQRQVNASIRSGLRAGRKNPRAVPKPRNTNTAADSFEWFWELTPTLRHIRDFAYARLAGPWAVLGVSMARVVAVVPPTVQLPPWAGGNASLNLFVGLVAVSGEGKGVPEKAAKDAFRLGPVYTTGIGSGQGINHLFAHYDGKAKETVMDRWSVYFSVPEVDTIASESGRTGSNLLPQLRKVWDGTDLTFGYVDRNKSVQVLDHSYRLAMVVGIQPARATALLGDVDGGTPQRYLWLPVDAPGIPMADVPEPAPIDLRGVGTGWPPMPTDLQGRLIAAAGGRPARVEVLRFPDAARDLIRDNRKRKQRKETTIAALDGHLGLCRMKAAAALALLHGEREVTQQFWGISEALMAMSQATRASVEAQLAEKERKANQARGKAQGEREVVADAVKEEAHTSRVAKGIVRFLNKNGSGTYALVRRDGCAGRDKKLYFDAALDLLVKAGTVEVVGDQVTLVTP